MSFYDENPSGRIVSRVTSRHQDFSNVVTLTINLLSQLLLVVLIVGVLFCINVRLALLTLIIAPLIVVVALAFRRIARATTRSVAARAGRGQRHVQETISGIAVAKNFRQESAIYDEFRAVNQQSYRVNAAHGLRLQRHLPDADDHRRARHGALVYFGGLQRARRRDLAGDWFLFVQSIDLFWFPLTSIASFWSQFQQGLAAGERVFALIDAEPRVVQTDRQPVPRARRARSSSATSTSATTTSRRSCADFNLTIPAGETMALVGHTGAGKSTLGKLIARFYEFQGGQILIDGHDIRTLDLASTGGSSGIVPQTPFLFSGTVADKSATRGPTRPTSEVARGRARRSAAATGSRRCRTAWRPRSASAGAALAWASGSWSRWRACCCRTRRSSSWTRRPPASIR